MKGKIILLDPENLKILSLLQSGFTKKDQWIEDIKVSPDNSMVAFGAHGGCSPIEVMHVKDGNTLQKWKRIDVALTSALLHLDWAKDCSAVVVNSQAYELMFVSIQTGKQITASSSTTIEWATWTCKLGWCVQGVFKGVEYFGTHTVDRAHNQKVLVTGDDDSLVSLYRYPSLIERAQYKGYIGHSSHVTRTRFSFDDSKVFSTGGNDKCVIVWNTDFGAGHPEE
jgi:microtubule-associated protein-like 6